MKDLQHLYYLEKLLTEVNNDLVRKGQARGDIAIGTTCFQLPEVLYSLPGAFPVYLRAPRTGSIDMGTYYMTSMTCEFARALLERALEGGYQFLDCIIGPAACSQMADCLENMERLNTSRKEDFMIQIIDVPMKADENAIRHLTNMTRKRVLEPLHEKFGIDISDKALKKAVKTHNEVCRALQEIGEYRKEETPRITGYEFAVLCLASYAAPKDLILPYLQDTVKELKTREPDEDAKKKYRARVLLAGSEIDDPDYIRQIEEAGAYVCMDRFCFGSYPTRLPLEVNDEEDILLQICRQNVLDCQCPRYMDTSTIDRRKDVIDGLAKEYHADGIIIEQMKFCNFWGYERAAMTNFLREDYGWPVLSLDKPYVGGGQGQLRTRVQAFVESIEIKQLRKGGAA